MMIQLQFPKMITIFFKKKRGKEEGDATMAGFKSAVPYFPPYFII